MTEHPEKIMRTKSKAGTVAPEGIDFGKDVSAMRAVINAGRYLMIAGPTAAGKSGLALALAQALNGVVINADSMQLYNDLRIVTARPGEDDEVRVPHRLYGSVDGGVRASVAWWLKHAAAAMDEARRRGRVPIIVGGTGMYLKAGLMGIAPIPDVPQEIHAAVRAQLSAQGGAVFRAELGKADPATANRLFDGDSQRLVRAMGVLRATGRPISDWQNDPHHGAFKGDAVTIALTPRREDVYAAINARFVRMMEEGAVDEVMRLAARQLDPGLPVMKALGVREIIAMQKGEIDRDRAIELACRDSRHYAKRQFTWLRHNFRANYSILEKYSKRNMVEIFSILSNSS